MPTVVSGLCATMNGILPYIDIGESISYSNTSRLYMRKGSVSLYKPRTTIEKREAYHQSLNIYIYVCVCMCECSHVFE